MKFITSRRFLAGLAMLVAMLVAPIMVFTTVAQATTPAQSGISSVSTQCTKTVLRINDKGSCVKQLQQALQAKNFSVGPAGADGKFGRNTKAAVYAYQDKYDLLYDGIVGRQVWSHLTKSSPPVVTPPPKGGKCENQVLSMGSRGDCVKQLQELLADRGEWIGGAGADGVFGNGTLRGLQHYQSLAGLKPDGIAGPLSWGSLQSGSVKTSHLSANCFNSGSWICTDKSDQKTYAFKNGQLIKVMPSRTGGWHYFKGQWMHHNTPTGTFGILNRVIDEKSNIYDGSPMPHSQYFTNNGHAFHGSPSFVYEGNYTTPYGQAGSGGCVNLLPHHAKWLWQNYGYGSGVVIQQ